MAHEVNDNKEQEVNPNFTDPSGKAEENFYHILLFLWTMIHKHDRLQALATIPASDSEATEWSDNIHFTSLKKTPNTNQININKVLADGIDRAQTDPENEESMTGVQSCTDHEQRHGTETLREERRKTKEDL